MMQVFNIKCTHETVSVKIALIQAISYGRYHVILADNKSHFCPNAPKSNLNVSTSLSIIPNRIR